MQKFIAFSDIVVTDVVLGTSSISYLSLYDRSYECNSQNFADLANRQLPYIHADLD
jgi:hypothetical protein